MATERRKDGGSDDDDSVIIECRTVDVRGKSKQQKSLGYFLSCIAAMFPSMRNSILTLSYNMKANPAKTMQRGAIKIGFYLWCLAVVLSVLSLIGIPLDFSHSRSIGFTAASQSNELSKTNGRVLSDVDAEDDEDSSSWQAIFPDFDLFGSKKEEPKIVPKKTGTDDDKYADEMYVPQQILPAIPKQGNTLNKKLEKELACDEQKCNAQCNEKIKSKCAKSSTCRKEREKLCKRRCRKQRCEDRCKDEPKWGYVEREQRMEKCKDECTGPTAVHNKCIKKCHSQFKPCKSRCHEIAGKYICDKPAELPSVLAKGGNDDEDDENDNEDIEESPDDVEGDDESDSDALLDDKGDESVGNEDEEDDDEVEPVPVKSRNMKATSSTKPLSVESIIAKGKTSRRSLTANDLLEDTDLI